MFTTFQQCNFEPYMLSSIEYVWEFQNFASLEYHFFQFQFLSLKGSEILQTVIFFELLKFCKDCLLMIKGMTTTNQT